MSWKRICGQLRPHRSSARGRVWVSEPGGILCKEIMILNMLRGRLYHTVLPFDIRVLPSHTRLLSSLFSSLLSLLPVFFFLAVLFLSLPPSLHPCPLWWITCIDAPYLHITTVVFACSSVPLILVSQLVSPQTSFLTACIPVYPLRSSLVFLT